MNLRELKQQIALLVNASEDEVLLRDVAEMLYRNKQAANELYYCKRLKESIGQADAGRLVSSTEVHKIARQWINK